jgi:hypothetical protein
MAASKRPRVTLSDLDRHMRQIDDRTRGQGVIFEEIRSQNRATIESVAAFRVALEARIDQVDRGNQARDAVLGAAVRQNSADIRKNGEDIRKNSDDIRRNSEDIRKSSEDISVLTARVEALGPLDQRVSALERRRGEG